VSERAETLAWEAYCSLYDLGHAVRGWWDRHPWATPAALVAVAVLCGGCGPAGGDTYCRGRFKVAATKADSAEIARSYTCGMMLGRELQ